MRVIFNKVELENFMSFGKAELTFNSNGYVLINGTNLSKDDNAKSNGSGKSSLLNSIAWALTGQTSNGIKDVENIYSKGRTLVELDFTVDGTDYVITREKNPTKLKFYVNGKDVSGKGIRDTEAIISEHLPNLNNELINSIIILGQGLPQRFTNNTPAGRKAVLENLSNADFMVEDLKTRIKVRSEELKTKLNDIVRKIDNIEYEKEYDHNRQLKVEEELNSIDKDSLIEELNIVQFEYNKAVADNNLIKMCIEENNDKKDKLNQERLSIYSKEQEELNNLDKTEIDMLEREQSSLRALLRSKKDEITKLENVKDVCPVCNQKLPHVHKIDTTALREEVNKITEQGIKNKAKLEKLKEDYNKKYEGIKFSYKIQLEEIDKMLRKIPKFELDPAERKLEIKLTSLQTELNGLDTRFKSLTEELDTLKNKKYEEVAKLIKEQDTINRRLEITNKMNTIITRDFRGYLLASIIDYINNKVKEYSVDVFGSDKLTFELKGNNISINFDNKEYEQLSGGEKTRVDIIMQLALRDMLQQYMNFSANILVIDEVTDFLDEKSAEAIYNLFVNKLTDVNTIYIISHRKDFTIPVDEYINVVKGEDNISYIE